MIYPVLALLWSGCGLRQAVVDASFPRYYEVEFLDRSEAAGVWSCARPRLEPKAAKLVCYDTTHSVLVLPGPQPAPVSL